MANPLIQFFHTKTKAALACSFIVVLLIGFLLGREQMKYQIRSRIAEGFSNMQNALAGSEQQSSSEESVVVTPPEDQPITMKFLKKGITMNVLDRPESIDFGVEYVNKTGRDIKAFIGVIAITDLFDRKIDNLDVTYEDGLKAGETKRWNGVTQYNMFREADKRLAEVDVSAMKAALQIKEIIFTDGTRQTF